MDKTSIFQFTVIKNNFMKVTIETQEEGGDPTSPTPHKHEIVSFVVSFVFRMEQPNTGSQV